jgi:hypothetical protein
MLDRAAVQSLVDPRNAGAATVYAGLSGARKACSRDPMEVRRLFWEEMVRVSGGTIVKLLVYSSPKLITPSKEVRTYRQQEGTAMDYSQATTY